VAPQPGGSWVLRIVLDACYPGIAFAARDAMSAVRGRLANITPQRNFRAVTVSSTWAQWPEVLPQHGPGRKHERSIALTAWPRSHTHAHPRALVRGLFHSDGCRFVAHQRSRGRSYAYVRYAFSNRSDDVKAILGEHLDLLGIGWRLASATNVEIARRADVAELERFVGPKL